MGSEVHFWGPISLCLCAFLGLDKNRLRKCLGWDCGSTLCELLKSRELCAALLLTRSGRQSLPGPPTPQGLSPPTTMLPSPPPQTSFEAKKWLEVNFPSRGKVKIFPQAVRVPFPQTLHFLGKQCTPRERESYFQGKIIPQRESLPSEEKSTQFSLGGKILPQKMFRAPRPLALSHRAR